MDSLNFARTMFFLRAVPEVLWHVVPCSLLFPDSTSSTPWLKPKLDGRG